ncbi:MAG: sigma-70 family RNA polymerase sigma factor [Phycisphaeraceae bacterium]
MAMNHEQIVQRLLADRTRILAFARAVVRNDDLAEDIFQSASVVALRRADQVDADGFLPWMRQVVRYQAMNELRQRNRRAVTLSSQVLDKLEQDWGETDGRASSQISLHAVDICMKTLTENAQNLIRLRYAEDLKAGQIAKLLDRKLNAVYVALTRIHRALAECIRSQLARQS